MTDYKLDRVGFSVNVLNAYFMVAHLETLGLLVKARAELIAPYDASDPDGQHYRDHFGVRAGKHGGIHHDRAYVEIYNDDMPTAIFVEYGFGGGVDINGNTYPAFEPRRVLGNALDAARG